jgi:hypothetical protein
MRYAIGGDDEGFTKAMNNEYSSAVGHIFQFFIRVDAEAVELNNKILSHADRMGRITKQGNPAEYDAIIDGMADDLELFARRIDELFPDYQRSLELVTLGFSERVAALDPATSTGAQELEGMRREARKLAETARGVQGKVTTLRNTLIILRDKPISDHRLSRSAQRVIRTSEELFTAYNDLETLALKISFSTEQDDQS